MTEAMATVATVETVAGTLKTLRQRIERAARAHGRDGDAVRLLAVSKGHGAEAISNARGCGVIDFGENRVQEAATKFAHREAMRDTVHREKISLHMIGPLQSNKVPEAVLLFDWIHTLASESLARALAKEHKRDRHPGITPPRLLVQVNTGEEPQKSGLAPADLDGFLARCKSEWNLKIEGLMCLPPQDEPASPHFGLLSELAKRHHLRELSMGMSADFEQAVALGATMIRVGTALFGPRTGTRIGARIDT